MFLFLKSFKHYFTIIFFLSTSIHALAQDPLSKRVYSTKERQIEEARIHKDIEDKLNWKNRNPKQLDDVADADRWLYSKLNESILLRRTTWERFGIFESFNIEKGTKIFEIRLHKKNKVTDRFPIHSPETCNKGIRLSADQVMSKFIVFNITCSSEQGSLTFPILFDYASRNCYVLSLNYDFIKNKSPHFTLQNGVYKLRWDVELWGQDVKQNIRYVFKIEKDINGRWKVKNIVPSDEEEGTGIFSLPKLPISQEYDLPSYVADWSQY